MTFSNLEGASAQSTEATSDTGHAWAGRPRVVPLRMACYKRSVAMFLVVLKRSGPSWKPELALEEQSDWPAHAAFMDGLVDAGFVVLGGPLADEQRVVHAVESESDEVIRATLAGDPWNETHLVIETVDPWTIRLDGRAGARPTE